MFFARALPRVLLPLLLTTLACVPPATPRFSPDIAAAIARDPMRRLETSRMVVYYPAPRRAEADRVVARVETCLDTLQTRAQINTWVANQKPVLVLPDVPLNNAFVAPPIAGQEPISVLPTYNTADFLTEMGIPSDPAFIGCHEITHYVQLLQIGGFHWLMYTLFGDVLSPQLGFDAWFIEGLATYYETALQPGLGRLSSPHWEGRFHAAVAQDPPSGGDLSFAKRTTPVGNHYLYGSHFIQFLVERYGEEALWTLIRKQGRSIVFPLFVDTRFYSVYGRTLGTLLDEFAADVARRFPPRPRPSRITPVRAAGWSARYAIGRDGTEALISSDANAAVRLSVFASDGRLRRQRFLHELLLPRKLVSPSSDGTQGLSVSADGRLVYFTLIDQAATTSAVRLVRYDVERDRVEVVYNDLRGVGGGLDDTGLSYVFAQADGDSHALAELDLTTNSVRTIAGAGPQGYFLQPRPSPDGTRVVTGRFEKNQLSLVIVDRKDGHVLHTISGAGASRDAPTRGVDGWFFDDQRVLYNAVADGRSQVFVYDLTTRRSLQVTDAPYLTASARPANGRVRFLDREGWAWTIGETALADAGVATSPAAPVPPAAPLPVDVNVLSDRPYSGWDHLFFPQARGLFATQTGDQIFATGWLGGGDRLGYHRWGVAVSVNPHNDRPSVGVEYSNAQLAPFSIAMAAADQTWWEWLKNDDDDNTTKSDRGRRAFALQLQRPFYTHAAGVALHASEDREFPPRPTSQWRRRLTGATAALELNAAESTAWGGLRRQLALSLSASAYPEGLSSLTNTFSDMRAQLSATAPVWPNLWRPTVTAGLRARWLAGLRGDQRFLQLGGLSQVAQLAHGSSEPKGPEFTRPRPLSDAAAFVEPLRGYEDFAVPVRRALIGDFSLRMPFIIDKGRASLLWIFPPFFVRELNIIPFINGAWDGENTARRSLHAAAGLRLSLSLVVGLLPLSLDAQAARRLVDDHASVFVIGIGLGL